MQEFITPTASRRSFPGRHAFLLVVALGSAMAMTAARADDGKKDPRGVTGSHIKTTRGQDAVELPVLRVGGAMGDAAAQPLDANEAARPAGKDAPEIATDDWLVEPASTR